MTSHPPLTGAQRWLITVSLAMATFMMVLDSSIANVAIPTISGNLGTSVNQGTWVVTSFAVANAISVPITGWLARRYGEVRVFMVSALGFIVASALCGLSQSLEMLIFFRVLQGGISGPLIPLSQSLLLPCYPRDKQGLALALWAMTVVVAPIFGPILGGWISDNWHWSGIFFINVPIGILVLWAGWPILRHRETDTFVLPVDMIGLALLVVGVGSLQIMLDKGKDLGWFGSWVIVTLAVVAVIGIVALIIWELTDPHPIIDLFLFRSRNFTIGTIAISLGYMLYFGAILLLPLLLQAQLGYTAFQAGLATAPVGILPVILSPLIGRFSHRIDLRWLASLSFLAFGGSFIWRAWTFEPGINFAGVAWPQFAQGLGVACFFMPLTALSLAGLRPDQIASASALSNFLRTLFGAIGASIVTTMWDRREAVHHVGLIGHLDPYNPAYRASLDQLAAAGLPPEAAKTLIAQQVTQQSYIIGGNELFWVSGLLFFALVIIVWFARRPSPAASATGGGH